MRINCKNSNGSMIYANIYKTDDGFRIAGTFWKKGTYDPRFNYGPYISIDEAKKAVDSL